MKVGGRVRDSLLPSGRRCVQSAGWENGVPSAGPMGMTSVDAPIHRPPRGACHGSAARPLLADLAARPDAVAGFPAVLTAPRPRRPPP